MKKYLNMSASQKIQNTQTFKIPGTKIVNPQSPPCSFTISSTVSLSSSGWIDVGPIERGHRETTKPSFGKKL